jgi:serine/threonine protein kinase/tetratricopeptide (TPR) repeat protein
MRCIIIDNRYKILKKCGVGATGEVYKVLDLKSEHVIALKILSKKSTSSRVVQRFKREFRLLTDLHHPNLCSVYDFGTLRDGCSYFTMEYVDGPDIFEFTNKLPREKIYPLIVQLCRVLEYIHTKGLIHYDIKPGNVLIAKGKEIGSEETRIMVEKGPDSKKPYALSPVPIVKLMDFGLADEHQLQGGTLIRGTFPYIAPEVIKGLAIDHRADLYSLGVLMYEIFTQKRLRVSKKTSFATFLKQGADFVFQVPSKIAGGIPQWLEHILVKLRDREYSRANEVITVINACTKSKFTLETEKTIEGYLLSSRFVGRDQEMALLTSLHAKARHGHGNVVIIAGDTGIGKSRLLREFKLCAQLKRNHCFIGYARKGTVGPLEPFYDIFRELFNYMKEQTDFYRLRKVRLSLAVLLKIFPDLADSRVNKYLPRLVPIDPQQEKLRNFEALSELLRYCALYLGGLVILLEDLHWADDLSIQLLEYLGRNVVGKNIFICGVCRKEELAKNLMLKKMMTHLRREGYLTMIELKPLTFKSLYSFLDSTITKESNSSALVRYLMEKTGGNPFFVEEIMRTLLQKIGTRIGERVDVDDVRRISIPGTVEQIVVKRLKGLNRNSQRIVEFSAILHKGFRYDMMKHLTMMNDTDLLRALWDLKRRQILIEEDNRYQLYHAALSEAVHKRLSVRKQKVLNYRAGKTLEHLYKKNLDRVTEDIAYYFIEARTYKKGIHYGLLAAKKSSERYANEQAIRFYTGVLDILGNRNLKLQFTILQELTQIEITVGRYDDAIEHSRRALSLRAGSIDKKINVYLDMSNAFARQGDYSVALAIYREALKLLKKMKKGTVRLLLETYLKVRICRAYQIIGDHKRAVRCTFDNIRLPQKYVNDKHLLRLLGSIYHNIGTFESIRAEYSGDDYNKAFIYHKQAYKYYAKVGDQERIAGILNGLGIAYYVKFDFQRAINCYKRVITISDKIGDQYGVATGSCNLGNALNDRGYLQDAVVSFQKALAISQRIGNSLMLGAAFLGLGECLIQQGYYREVLSYAEQGLKIMRNMGWKEREIPSILLIGTVYKEMGDYTTALKQYRKALRIAKKLGHRIGIAALFAEIGSLYEEIGKLNVAKKYIENSLRIVINSSSKKVEIDCYRYLSHIHVLIGDYRKALQYYELGVRCAKKIGLRRALFQFFLLYSAICYYIAKHKEGVDVVNRVIKFAKEKEMKNIHAEALLYKVKNGLREGSLLKMEALNILDEAMNIASDIGRQEVIWRLYFEYGRLYQDDKQYSKALDYYKRCSKIFREVGCKIKSETNREYYLKHPDRRTVFTAIHEIEKLLD